ncbi:MAG TPA: efflux RND transporter periplasmic adaptor subunit [Desulfuromonadaceae bacterium]
MTRSAFALLCLGAALFFAGCSGNKQQDKKEAAVAAIVKGVTLETVKSTPVPETLEVVGAVRARTSAVVSARVPGTISVLRVREGDRVKKGQLLAQLEAQENAATAAVASAALDEAHRGLESARARKRLSDATFERYHKLFTDQAVTRQEFDIRQTEKELADQEVARAEARVKQAQQGSRAATTMADYTRIVAPISGVITARQADLGATVFPAQPLMTIEDEGTYQLELAVPESVMTRIRPGTPVQVTMDTLGSSFGARIAEIVPAADAASHTFIAKVSLGQKGIKSGMFGRGAIDLGTRGTGVLLPAKAVVERGALTSVWVVGKDNIARMRLVKVGKAVGERVEILSGLADGERVVVSGGEKVGEGARIE